MATLQTMAPAMAEPKHLSSARAALEQAWQRRRPWSRTDTARFLDDRSEPLLALLRRRPGEWPKHSRQFGQWLRTNQTRIFDRAHRLLAGQKDDAARERMIPSELV
jgi:hypothetical protein